MSGDRQGSDADAADETEREAEVETEDEATKAEEGAEADALGRDANAAEESVPATPRPLPPIALISAGTAVAATIEPDIASAAPL